LLGIFGIFLRRLPSNDRSSSHFTQRLFLHYLRKTVTEQAKYALKWAKYVN